MAELPRWPDGGRSAVERLTMPGHGGAATSHGLDDTSVFTVAMSAMEAFESEALAETAEDLSMVLGARRTPNNARRAGQDNAPRARVLALTLIAELGALARPEMVATSAGDDAWFQSEQPRAALARTVDDPGQMALHLAAALAHAGLSAEQRRRLERALGALLAEDDVVLSLFGALAFQPLTPTLRQSLRRLQQRAGAAPQSLSQWLRQLGARSERQATLRTMIRVLSFELSCSGEPIVGSHLAEVIGELQRLLLLLGLEQHCDAIAARLACPPLDGEGVLACVVQLTEQLWADIDLVAQSLPEVATARQYDLVHALAGLVPRLPLGCFVDAEQRERLHGVLLALRDRVLDA